MTEKKGAAEKRASKSQKPEAEEFPRKQVDVWREEGDSDEEFARKSMAMMTTPEMFALRVIKGVEKTSCIRDEIDVPSLLEQLHDQAAAVNSGDLSQAESMLINQATALQSLFTRLTERAMVSDKVPVFEVSMRMALRAQNQCRATLETLATIKNPPVIYARQANVTTGPQQINNGTAAPSRAREIENEQSQLSGETHELLPDTRTSGEASRINPALEALGEIDRAKI